MCVPLPACLVDLDYDANGNVITKATPSGTTTFSYDPLDRIDTEAGPAGARNHDFDAGGNRTTDGAGATASFTPSTDRLATINGVAVTLDAAGNLTSDGTYKYLWNSLGQLGELRKPDNTLIATYYYDHQNLRTRKVTTSAAPQGISKTFYHYDQAGHLIAETTPGNTPQATYIWNGDILTGFIVHQPTRTVYTVQTDHLGSPFQVRTLAGKVVWRWESEAFGKTAPNEDVDGDGAKLTLNLRFPGQYFDKESGLHYNWNRYYSPRLARYISSDPIGLSGGANLYAYGNSNPLSFIDPFGLISETEVANIIFNETRSFSGSNISQARDNIAQAIFNGAAAEESGKIRRRPMAASSTAKVPKSEAHTYQACLDAAAKAEDDRINGIDPTNGAMNFNFRNNSSRKPFQGFPIQTQVGPLNNSFTRGGLNSTGVYANTYGR